MQDVSPVFIKGSQDIDIKGICHDSRHYQQGQLFIAIRGHQFDGHLFISEACNRQAPAIVVEDDRVVSNRYSGTIIKVKNSRHALEIMAANFFEKPSEKLAMIGVTGTNGKTTTAAMIEAVLNGFDFPTAVIGTINNHFRDKKMASSHTTPDALDLQELLATYFQSGAKAVSMEVSSHAIALSRVENLAFDVCVFTNLTRDHLDFHNTMDNYIKTKARLFREILKKSLKKTKRAILNCEDSHMELMKPAGLPIWTFGISKGDFRAEQLDLGLEGSRFTMITPMGKQECHVQLIGRHNVLNSLAAAAVGVHFGMPLPKIAEALSRLSGVPGRLQRVEGSLSRVFVDYAHSEDALKNVLGFLKKLRDERETSAQIITLFGCGGDRDKGKRPQMLKAALAFSDAVVVTSDNPRTEDPQKIIDDILAGRQDSAVNIIVEIDRKKAIELAIKKARPKDIVLIAGKGHEDYQIIGTKKYPFDDYQVAKELLKK